MSRGSVSSASPSPSNPAEGISGERNNAASTIARGVAEILQWDIRQGPLYIQNNVPYIDQLSEGSSPKAAPGWVEEAFSAGSKFLK